VAVLLIFDIEVTDPEGYEEYRRLASATHGGEFVVRGGKAENLEGDWQPNRVVIQRFDTREAALAWYNSPAYEAAKAVRHRTARSRAILVETA
jgi:uncharacterized protein (DUF1330 family)